MKTTSRPKPPPTERRSAWLMVAPALALLLVFTYAPAVLSLVASGFDVPLGGGTGRFVGIANYRDALSDPDTWQAGRNTLLYCAMTIVPSLTIGFALAVLAAGRSRRHTVLSAVLFLPFTANLVAMAVVFRWVFAFRGGLANSLLGIVGIAPINYLGDTSAALPTVAAVGVWRTASFCMVLFLAGLTAIPTSIHEAAAMDGVRGAAKVVRVLLPLIRPTVVVAAVMSALQAIQVFDTVEVMTDGGPLGATETMLTFTWRVGFERFDLGRSAALSFLLLVVLLAIGWSRRSTVLRADAPTR